MFRPRVVALAAGLIAGAAGIVGRAAEVPAERPNIVLAIADDWGWPHAGAYGDRVVQTPHFDRIARQGVLFTQAFTSCPSCTPSRGALITGQYFFRLDAGANLWSVWPEGRFAEFPALLEEAGYHVGSYRKAWGPGRGRPGGTPYRDLDAFFAARPSGAPFCLWFGSSDPHRPYEPGSGEASGMDLDQVHLFPHFPDAPEVRSDVADYYFEVQRFDRQLGALLERIERMGELEHTLIVVTGDHGMPFPRCKGNVYDSGTRVPLAAMWPAAITAGRTVTDLVSLTDLAPTFLEAAGVAVPEEMTGRSLLGILRSSAEGRVDPRRSQVVLGRERHTVAQERPDTGGYPVRALRTDEFLYVRNWRPDRWPAGTPRYDLATTDGAWLADCDNGPTKMFLWRHREDPLLRPLYDLSFAKRPAEELYDLRRDPGQLNNVAGDSGYARKKAELAERLEDILTQAGDPRVLGEGDRFDHFPYLGGAPKWPGREGESP